MHFTFEDTGTYYANRGMVEDQIVLSMNSHLIYDISNAEDVRIIKKATDIFYNIAQADIQKDGPCFYGEASIFRDSATDTLLWEY